MSALSVALVKESGGHVTCFRVELFQDRQARTKGLERDAERTHHRPTHDPVFCHEVLCHRRRDLGHVVAVILLAHAWLTITTDSQTEDLAGSATRRRFWEVCRDGAHVDCAFQLNLFEGIFFWLGLER